MELENKIIDLTIELLEKYYYSKDKYINWNVRFTPYIDNIGECDWNEQEIRYNSIILENNDFETIKHIVYHEVAHVINGQQNNHNIHGHNFRKINKMLGGKVTFVKWNPELKKIILV